MRKSDIVNVQNNLSVLDILACSAEIKSFIFARFINDINSAALRRLISVAPLLTNAYIVYKPFVITTTEIVYVYLFSFKYSAEDNRNNQLNLNEFD